MKAKFTPEEDRVWTDAWQWYVEEGWDEEEAAELAWRDTQKAFPRLLEFDGAEAGVDG